MKRYTVYYLTEEQEQELLCSFYSLEEAKNKCAEFWEKYSAICSVFDTVSKQFVWIQKGPEGYTPGRKYDFWQES